MGSVTPIQDIDDLRQGDGGVTKKHAYAHMRARRIKSKQWRIKTIVLSLESIASLSIRGFAWTNGVE